jgi:phosphoribosylanthranilate isomerase
LHLCGTGFLDFVAAKPGLLRRMERFQRIQLNLDVGEVEGRYDLDTLARRVRESAPWEFILQYAGERPDLLARFAGIRNHSLLFDASAGRGIAITEPPVPIAGHACGYAGGIHPGNVAQILAAIAHVVPSGETWIDMESGVRTDDRFDLAKVRQVLDVAQGYWKPTEPGPFS